MVSDKLLHNDFLTLYYNDLFDSGIFTCAVKFFCRLLDKVGLLFYEDFLEKLETV